MAGREPQLLGAPGAPKPAEERSYLLFAAVALFFVLGVGLALGIVAAFAGTQERVLQAHAAAQLQGWLGMFVAGMGLRLMPRLAGRRPLPRAVTLSVLALLAAGAVLRVVAAAIDRLMAPAALLTACGSVLFAGAVAVALASRGRAWQAWRLAAWAGAAWWIGWALLGLVGALRATAGVVPEAAVDAWQWVGLGGALSNFVWAVQGRSVPVFYGRRPPALARLAPPLVLLNAGVALAALSAFGVPTLDAGLALAGAATIWLAPLAGSVWGRPHRLRPVSQPAARFLVAANAWAVVGGLLLVASAAAGLAGSSTASALRDAALHALGLGLMTTLILGMAQLLMPAFAAERQPAARPRPETRLSWPLLLAATALRVAGSGLAGGLQVAAVATSGVLAWLALGVFALGLARAARGMARS